MTAEPAAEGRDVSDDLLIDALRIYWQGVYDVGYAGGAFLARRITGGDLLTAETPGGLESAIRTDRARWLAS